MEHGKVLLSTNNLSTGYVIKKQATPLAANININLYAGKVTALIGANGTGKSTLLKTLTGLQKPLAGTVLLNNKDIVKYAPQDLAQLLAVVLTEPLPPSNLTVYEVVALGRQPYTNWISKLTAEDHNAINQALELTQTMHLLHKKHFEISDGQLQKVLIARALAQDTPLIVLDEPTTHLDFQHKAALLRLLKKLAHEAGKCILYSTHDLDMALQISDELLVIKKKNIIQGTVSELIDNNTFNNFFEDDTIVFNPCSMNFNMTTD